MYNGKSCKYNSKNHDGQRVGKREKKDGNKVAKKLGLFQSLASKLLNGIGEIYFEAQIKHENCPHNPKDVLLFVNKSGDKRDAEPSNYRINGIGN